MLSRWLAFVVWALLGATVVTWLLQFMSAPLPVPAHAIAVDTAASVRTDMTRLFGKPAAAASEAAPTQVADDRLKLIGLAASLSPTDSASSLALISLDGKPPKSYRIGSVIDGDRQVLAIRKGSVDIGPSGGPVAFSLTLPGLPPPATGTPQSMGGPVPGVAPGQAPAMAPGAVPQPPPAVEMQPQPAAPPPPVEAQPIAPPQVPPAQPA
jgi:general secretion pathway protein C